jgi:ribonucleotide reductase alpha subunit
LWKKSISSLVETGAPMITFKDAFNRRNPQRHVGSIKSSNLCVAPETTVLTRNGFEVISDLENEFVDVWNGGEWSNVQVVKTGENQELVKVTTTIGNTLECTHYHKFYIDKCGEIIETRAIDLIEGDKLISFNSPSEDICGYVDCHIESVKLLFGLSDTYCFNEPKRHMGVFNGLLTGNCSEIGEVTSTDETAVCNLGSINAAQIEFDDIKRIVPIVIRALDNVICGNFYPSDKAKHSNFKHRPIGLGIMGWFEYLVKHDIDFESQQHLDECDRVFEEISYWAIKTSCELAKEKGKYESFEGSDWSKGIMPFMTDKTYDVSQLSQRWIDLVEEVIEHGVRNSVMIAIAPTATIANILGTTQSIEPPHKLSYMEENLSGKFRVIDSSLRYNKPYLTKTAFEINQDWIIKAAAVRQKWIDQAQSLNLFKKANVKGNVISDWYFLAWELGLKSTYYLRGQVTEVKHNEIGKSEEPILMCSIDQPDCEACS